MLRGATLFSGGGGVEALLKARIDFVHAVEYDPAIAAVYRQNHGDHIQVARVEDVDYSLTCTHRLIRAVRRWPMRCGSMIARPNITSDISFSAGQRQPAATMVS